FDVQPAGAGIEDGVAPSAAFVGIRNRQVERATPEGRRLVHRALPAVDHESGKSAAMHGGGLAVEERLRGGAGQLGRARSSSSALRKRAASPPVQARWSKVSDSGRIRRGSKPPTTGTIAWRPRPAATMATQGGSTTGVA